MAIGAVINVYKKVATHYFDMLASMTVVRYIGGRVECAPGTRGTVQVYPYDEKDPCGPSRDHKHTLLHAQEATSSGKPVNYWYIILRMHGDIYLCVCMCE